jgi:colanic acid biosynthesis protein WcaH
MKREGKVFLDSDTFKTVVANTPLVSIDLVVRNSMGEFLLGHRTNRPARGYWFAPGGRILKNESLDQAFNRISEAELGKTFKRGSAKLLGVYEHFYRDSSFGIDGDAPDTHYVVLGYLLEVQEPSCLTPPPEQHDSYRWWTASQIKENADVHDNIRAFLAALS